eukprot:TRINITY_DN68303_c0_g1_i1.p1 TRINITY_DN68303_c0_g1~~TRINITY_DN68303_c0_g1_i1.p1  ORF type:complete len:101 (+),score=8.85 TRINITY_DN68303_c0_g1_i1:187-489(+)
MSYHSSRAAHVVVPVPAGSCMRWEVRHADKSVRATCQRVCRARETTSNAAASIDGTQNGMRAPQRLPNCSRRDQREAAQSQSLRERVQDNLSSSEPPQHV